MVEMEPLLAQSVSPDQAARVAVRHKLLLTLSYAVAFGVYCGGLRWRYLADLAGDLNPFGYTQLMFLLGLAWTILELLNVWTFRPAEARYWGWLSERLKDRPGPGAAAAAEASRDLAARSRSSYWEGLGVVVGMTVWVPDPLRKRLVTPAYNSGFSAACPEDLAEVLGVAVFVAGAAMQYSAHRRRAAWMEAQMASACEVPGEPGFGGPAATEAPDPPEAAPSSGSSLRRWIPSVIECGARCPIGLPRPSCRHPVLFARLLVLLGWGLCSLNGVSLLYVLGCALEFLYSEIPGLEEKYRLLYSPEVWDGYCERARWSLVGPCRVGAS